MFEPMGLTSDMMIKVIGVGGSGDNVAKHVVCEYIEGVGFFAVSTDAQTLRKTAVKQTIQISSGITEGLDAGTNPEVGHNVADEGREALRTVLDGVDVVFIATGIGGGTDIGVVPMVAEVAKDLDILTVAVVTKPFNPGGKKRVTFAKQGITELSEHVDSLITTPNNKLSKVLERGISPLDTFDVTDDVLKDAVQGIIELVTRPGLMDVDFANVRAVVSKIGYAMMGLGVVSSEDRAEEAAGMAISPSLLEDIDLSGTRGALVNITAGSNLRLDKFETVGSTIRTFASGNMTVVAGTSLSPDMNDEPHVTVAATGIGIDKRPEITLVTNRQVRQLIMNRYQ